MGWIFLQRPRRGFTLVELLVVIGIIAVLIGILIPTLGKARANAQMTACKSNLQQIGNATRMYANDNKDRYPDSYTLGGWNFRRAVGENNPLNPGSYLETYGLNAVFDQKKYLPGKSAVWICPSATDDARSYKCTYSFALIDYNSASSSQQEWRTQKMRGRAKTKAWWVNDNIQYRPWTTGFRKGTSESTSGMLLTDTTVVYPHNYRTRLKTGQTGRTGSINVLFGDGAVGVVTFVNIGANLQDSEVLRGE